MGILPMDQGIEAWIHAMGCSLRIVLRIHGSFVGWIRLHHLYAPAACICSYLYGPLQHASLRELYHLVCPWNNCKHANSLCRLLACQDKRAYACSWYLRLLATSCIH